MYSENSNNLDILVQTIAIVSPLLQEESSYLQKESSYLRKESSHLRKESSHLRKESSHLRKESSYLRKESSYLRKEKNDLRKENWSMFNKVCQKNKTNKFDIWKKRNLILKNLPKRL
jgi:predicted nuclease with TOPRIM domain